LAQAQGGFPKRTGNLVWDTTAEQDAFHARTHSSVVA